MICILGGTFDPVHYGHLRPALDVQQALEIPCVHLLPCRVPPHRDTPSLPPDVRRELLELAIADQPALQLDLRELNRDGPSYMVDTLQSLRDELGDEPLCLALGEDAFSGLKNWDRWQKLRGLCHLVVMHRPGNRAPDSGVLADWLQESCVADAHALQQRPAGDIFRVDVTQLSISSTQIRQLLKQGRSPRYLLPDVVLQRIEEENWYANE